jgi:hypothetical protein
MELTSYNSYTITPGRWNPFNSDDLKAMKIADARIEAEFAAMYAAQVGRPLTVSQPEDTPATRKRAYNRRYYEAHREKIQEQKREYNKRYDATHPRDRADYSARYWLMNKDRINERKRLRKAAKKEATP